MEELIKKIIKEAEKYGNVEVLCSLASTSSVEYEKENLSYANSGTVENLLIRLSKGKQFGFSKTNNLNDWEKCVKRAYQVMKVSQPLDLDISLQNKSKYKKIKGLFSKKIDSVEKEEIVNWVEQMIRAAKDVDKRIAVPGAGISIEKDELYFANSNGVFGYNKANLIASTIETQIGQASGSESKVKHQIYDFSAVGESAAKLCVSSLNPKQVKTTKGNLILNYFAVAEIFNEVLIPAFFANNVQQNKSFLKGKLGEEVFSKAIQIEDNGTLEKGLFSRQFDAEGTKSQRTVLVKNGVVKNYLYDCYSARKDNVKSTGNCVSLEKVPSIGATNFVINSGKYTKDQMISETKEGVIAEFAFGSHVANFLTGDISIGLSNAFYIKDGSVQYPIKQVMVSFNLFEALKNVQMLGKELRQETKVVAPLICLEDVQIIGS